MPNAITDPWPDYFPLFQSGFSGGINVSIEPNKISDSEYVFLQNARVRDGIIKAIKSPKLLTDIPKGITYQGLEAINNYLILIAGGRAFFKDLSNPSAIFKSINPFQLDRDVENIYTQLVPESTLRNIRRGDESDPSVPGGLLAATSTNTPGALVCQDGIKRPRAIFSDGSTRILRDYSDWTINSREYVPIGKQMAFVDGILYIISADGKRIYRSVTGRPLDFVVAIRNDGSKVANAEGTSHAVDFNTITGISVISGNQDSNIVVSSKDSSHLLALNFDRTLYGEPTFNTPFLFPTGMVNQFCLLNTPKDSVLIDGKGLRSFNATRQLTVESNSDIFSRAVYKFFGTQDNPIIQDAACSIMFDNYALFAVNTIYGYGILVYDTQFEKFVSFDQYEGITKIKKFSVTKVAGVHRLFFITQDNRLFEAYTGDEVERVKFYSKEISSGSPKIALKLKTIRAYFNNLNIIEDGDVSCKVVVDRRSSAETVESVSGEKIVDAPYPLNSSTIDSSSSVTFDIDLNPSGYSIGSLISWKFDGELVALSLETQYQRDYIPSPESARRFSNIYRPR